MTLQAEPSLRPVVMTKDSRDSALGMGMRALPVDVSGLRVTLPVAAGSPAPH